ncbi:hypothetical protein CRUP_035201, partial [Coryphaenoides rupestris]
MIPCLERSSTRMPGTGRPGPSDAEESGLVGCVESVSDGLFHTVELLIQNHSLSLVVDNGAPKSLGKLPRQPSVDHNTQLYIG